MIGEKLCFAIVFAAEAMIAWLYLEYILSRKNPLPILICSFGMGYAVLFVFSFLDDTTVNAIMFCVVNFILIKQNYSCSIKTTLLHSAFMCFAMVGAEVLVALWLGIYGYEFSAYTNDFRAMIALAILGKLLYSEVRARYNCHYRTRHPDKCDGPSGYGVTKLDGIMDHIIRYQLSKISTSSGNDIIKEQNEKSVALAKAQYRLACNRLSEKEQDLADYKAETIRIIRGESKLTIDLLNELIDTTQREIAELNAAVENARQELSKKSQSAAQEEQEYNQLKSWADLYDNCNFAAKKMIVSQFIKSVHVFRGYKLEVAFNVSFEEFQELAAQCEDLGNERTAVYAIEKEQTDLPN